MDLLETLAMQCRKPSGVFGSVIGMVMNVEHNALRTWGFGHIDIPRDGAILDIGCGGGKAVKALADAASLGKVYGIDYSHDMVRLSSRVNKSLIKGDRVEITHGSVSSLPFENGFFDVITAFETTFFWPDFEEGLKEVNRVLKQSGTLLIVNENYKNGRCEIEKSEWIQKSGIHLYSPQEYRDILDRTGYGDIEINELPDKHWIAAVAQKP